MEFTNTSDMTKAVMVMGGFEVLKAGESRVLEDANQDATYLEKLALAGVTAKSVASTKTKAPKRVD